MPREIRHHLIVLSGNSLKASMKCARKSANPKVRRECIFSSYDLPHDGDHGRTLCELIKSFVAFAA